LTSKAKLHTYIPTRVCGGWDFIVNNNLPQPKKQGVRSTATTRPNFFKFETWEK